MKAKGLDKKQFAELMNETEDTITEWLSGTCDLTNKKIKIEEILKND
jgi:DNA-binding transcriptional regulator YiaG